MIKLVHSHSLGTIYQGEDLAIVHGPLSGFGLTEGSTVFCDGHATLAELREAYAYRPGADPALLEALIGHLLVQRPKLA